MKHDIITPSDLHEKNIKRTDSIKFTCVKCGCECEITSFRKYRIPRYETMLCENCYREKQSLENWGTRKPQQSEKCKAITEAHNMEKYGKPYIHTYGSKEWCDNMETKYGVKYAQQSESIREITKSNNVKKYGVDHWAKTEDHDNRIKDMIFKAKETCAKKYGVDSYSKTQEFNEKKITKCVYNGIKFDSIAEMCVYIFCISNGIPIFRNTKIKITYTDMNGKEYYTFPDFIINGKLVEIKGRQFYGKDGVSWIHPFNKKKVNGNWISLTLEEKEFLNDKAERKRRKLIEQGVMILKDTDIWVQNCINWVNTLFSSFSLFIWQFVKNTFENISYGYTPYNCDKTKEYQKPVGIGLTPFNIGVKYEID